MITIKERYSKWNSYSRRYNTSIVPNGKTVEVNVELPIPSGCSLVDDISEKEINLKRGGYLIVIGDKVLFKGNKPYYRPSLSAARETVMSMFELNFLKNFPVSITEYYGSLFTSATKVALLEDMESSDYVEIFKK